MKVFKTIYVPRSQNKSDKFIGCYMNEEQVANITLVSLGKGITKSPLLRTMLTDWLKDKNPVQLAATQAYLLWNSKGSDWRPPLEEFKMNLKMDLIFKKIPDSMIDQVLKEFKILINESK